ncbi:MAG: carbon storage regulator [Pirellulales bacterium]|nr:carbon storage regulator [Pirellulales bacterium]
MLVLSRRKGETIVIDNDIRVTVLEVKGNRVKLGVEAPSGIRIARHEVASSGRKQFAAEPDDDPTADEYHERDTMHDQLAYSPG